MDRPSANMVFDKNERRGGTNMEDKKPERGKQESEGSRLPNKNEFNELRMIIAFPFVHFLRIFQPSYPTIEDLRQRLQCKNEDRYLLRQLQRLERANEMLIAIVANESLRRRVYFELFQSPEAKRGRPIEKQWEMLQHLCIESSTDYRERFGDRTIDCTARSPSALLKEDSNEAS